MIKYNCHVLYYGFNPSQLIFKIKNRLPYCYRIISMLLFPLCLLKTNNHLPIFKYLGFPGRSVVKTRPAIQETQVPPLGWEDLLEKETAIHSSVFAWEIPWTEEPGGLQSMGSQKVRHN